MAEDNKIAADAPITVGVINASETMLKDVKNEDDKAKLQTKLQTVVDALNIQVKEHFFPFWGKKANIVLVENDNTNAVPYLTGREKWWWLVLADNSDRAGFFGYHDTTTKGMPLGMVFVKTAQDARHDWTVTASHELLEMLTDPWLNMCAFRNDENSENKIYAYDICDPCQEDKYWIHHLNKKEQETEPSNIEGWVAVSNFVYPTWFMPECKGALHYTHYDHMKHIKRPFTWQSGGFISVYDVKTGWHQEPVEMSVSSPIYNWIPYEGSRRQRRSNRMSGNSMPPPRSSPKIPRFSF